MKKILITGGAGLVGSILIEGLKNNFEIRILDQKAVEGIDSRAVSYTHLRAHETREDRL